MSTSDDNDQTIVNLRQALGNAEFKMGQMQAYRDEAKLNKISTDAARAIEDMFVGGFRTRADRFGTVQSLIKQLLVTQAQGVPDWNPKAEPVLE